MNNFMSHMSHMSQFSLPLYIDTCLFFTPAHAKEREKASISKSMQNSVISVISVISDMLLFCRQSLSYRRLKHDRDSNHNFFYSRFLSRFYRITRGRHTHTPPGFGSCKLAKNASRAMPDPPSPPARCLFFQLDNISICQVGRTIKRRESVGVSGVIL